MENSFICLAFLCLIYIITIQARPKDEGGFFDEDSYYPKPPTKSLSYQAWSPHVVPGKKDVKKTTEKYTDPCAGILCRLGRVCKVNSQNIGKCVCGDDHYCDGHRKTVCGTDGQWYPSHCELHRTACVSRKRIGIDHGGKTCGELKNQKEPFRVSFDFFEKAIVPKIAKNFNKGKVNKKDLEFQKPEEVRKEATKKKEEVQKEKDVKQESRKEKTLKYSEQFKGKQLSGKDQQLLKQLEQEHRQAYGSAYVNCTENDYKRFKEAVLKYHCARMEIQDCQERKQYLGNMMFNYYDQNSDGRLTESELDVIQKRDLMNKITDSGCTLPLLVPYIILYDESDDKKDEITLEEFTTAFDIPNVRLDSHLKTFTYSTTAEDGKGIELKCGIQGTKNLVWKRNSVDLSTLKTEEVEVLPDGRIVISDLGLHHMGNYTCNDQTYKHVVQTHVLKVQVPPTVKVMPPTRYYLSGNTVRIRCHADGIPTPDIEWQVNEKPVPEDAKHVHFARYANNHSLEILSADFHRDTGAYKCLAKNNAGKGQDISTVFIGSDKQALEQTNSKPYETFIVFHDQGFNVYRPGECTLNHAVRASFDKFRHQPLEEKDFHPTLCENQKQCPWGTGVNVNNKYVYVSQPELNRVVLIDIEMGYVPIQVIPTDPYPVKLHYIPHLDEVWILCWNFNSSTGSKTIVVIKQASEAKPHHTVHTQPVGDRFDMTNTVGDHFDTLQDMFLPPSFDLKHKFGYGYIVHKEQQGLHKIDLKTMQYVKTLDFKPYECVPIHLAYVILGGYVVIDCKSPVGQPNKPKQILMDYLTDAVMTVRDVKGIPYVSPDSRYIISIDNKDTSITVQRVNDDGQITYGYRHDTGLDIGEVAFFPSETGKSYDFYATVTNKNDLVVINLEKSKLEIIEGVGKQGNAQWLGAKHVIASSGIFGDYLLTPSKSSVIIFNGRSHRTHCEWTDIPNTSVIVWVESKFL